MEKSIFFLKRDIFIYTKLGILSTNWLPEPRINITIDFDAITNALQDVRCVGELRERWKEIKKLLHPSHYRVTHRRYAK